MALRLLIAALLVATAEPADACTVTLKADGNTAAIQHAMDRPGKPVVCLHPGVYNGARLVVTKSLTLRNIGRSGPNGSKERVVLKAGGHGRVLTVPTAGIDVTLEGITLAEGRASQGGGILIDAAANVVLRDCWLTANEAANEGGGAIAANAGRLTLVRTRVTHNTAEHAAGLDLLGTVQARVVASLIADNSPTATGDAPIRLGDAAALDLVLSTIAYNGGNGVFVQPRGGLGRSRVTFDSCIVMGKPDTVAVARNEAEHIRISRSVLYGGLTYVATDLQTVRALPGFNLVDAERYRPVKGSPAIARGKCTGPDAQRDLSGRPRPAVCSAGALEAPPDAVRATLKERAAAAKKKPKPDPW
jgi:hypothetical protein